MLSRADEEKVIKPCIDQFQNQFKKVVQQKKEAPKGVLAYYNSMQNLVKNKLKNSKGAQGKEEMVDDFVIQVFKYMIENQIFEDESFRIGLLTNRIFDYSSFCQYYDFKLRTEMTPSVRVVAEKVFETPKAAFEPKDAVPLAYMDEPFPDHIES